MPFVKGQSGNPGGRPKSLEKRVREMLAEREVTVDADGNETEDPRTDEERMIAFLKDVALARNNTGAKMRDRLEACKIVFDRGHGKARQTVDIHTDNDQPVTLINVETATDQQLERFERMLLELDTQNAIDVTPVPPRLPAAT